MLSSLLFAGTMVLGNLDEVGSADKFCKELKSKQPHTLILNSGGGIVLENYKAVQCIRQTDTIVKVASAHSAAAFMLHGIPYKCIHPQAKISLHNVYHADTGESLQQSREVYSAMVGVYEQWKVPAELYTQTLFVAMMTPSAKQFEVSPENASVLYQASFCAVGE